MEQERYKTNFFTIEKAEAIASLCKKYGEWLMVDVYRGHYCVDGASLLGLISFVGHEVEIEAVPKEGCAEEIKNNFYEELKVL